MLEFRAGKMSLQGTRVVPDARKGLVRIARVISPPHLLPVARYWLVLCTINLISSLFQGEEGLVHFQWLDRTLNAVEDVSFALLK